VCATSMALHAYDVLMWELTGHPGGLHLCVWVTVNHPGKSHGSSSIWPSGLWYYAVMQVTEKASSNH